MRKAWHALVVLAVTLVSTVATGAVAAAQPAGAPCAWAASACVDLSSQQAWLMENGQVTYGPTPVATGKPGWETPPGRFEVLWKDIDHRSRQFNNAPMPYSVFFTTTGIAFHEGNLAYKSHGCVRLGHAAAKTFFDHLQVGEEVQVVQ